MTVSDVHQSSSEGEIQKTPVDEKAEARAKNDATTMDVEVGDVELEPTRYSKLSVILMVVFSGLAIGSDGFNSALVGQLEIILAEIYPNSLTTTVESRLSTAFLVGMIIGMLGFGYISDAIGRKSGAVLTTLLLVLGIVLSAVSHGTSEDGMFWMLIIARGIAGVGAGGEYPVANSGAAEAMDDNKTMRERRGFLFAMITDFSSSMGFVFAGLVPVMLLLCFHQKPEHYEKVWRISFTLGVIPPLSIFWFRYRMAVSTAERRSSIRKQRIPYHLAIRRYWRPLLGASLSWFVYNYIAYPFGLFSSTIISRVNAGESIVKNIGWGSLLNTFYIPGAIVGGLLSDPLGRRRTMTIGFFLQATLGFILGGALGKIETILPLFIVLYGVFLSLGEVAGSNVAAISSEYFPTSIRGQMMGICAAVSKAGAAIGTSVFKPILASWGGDEFKGNQAVFLIGSGFAMLGAIIAWSLISAEKADIVAEDEAWKQYLKDYGYDIQWGDQTTKDPEALKFDAVKD